MARICYMCPKPAESREHVIPSALGGRWKTAGLLCTSCNSKFGDTIDAAICRELGTPMNMLGLSRDRGTVPRQAVRVPSGDEYLRDADGNLSLRQALVREQRDGKLVSVNVQASTVRQARDALRRLASKYPGKIDVDHWLARFESQSQFHMGPTQFEVRGAGSDEMFRAITKIAINAYMARGGSRDQISAAIEHIKGNAAEEYVRWFYAADVMPSRAPDEVTHAVAVRGAPGGQLWAYVELFRVYRFAVRLSLHYTGPPISLDYVFDLCHGEDLDRRLEVDFAGLDIDAPGIELDALKAEWTVLMRIAERRSREAAVDAAVRAAFAQAWADNPEATTEDLMPHLWSQLEPIILAMVTSGRRHVRAGVPPSDAVEADLDVAGSRTMRGGRSDERSWAAQRDGRSVIVLADGAGGLPGGEKAAALVVQHVQTRWETDDLPASPEGLCEVLRELDLIVSSDATAGETTAVVLLVHSGAVIGSTVGDSEVWLVGEGEPVVLTEDQDKRRLGGGRARPVAFGPAPLGACRLLAATDGLFGFVPRERVLDVCRDGPCNEAADRLVEAARASDGTFADDVTVVLVERQADGR